METIRFSNPRFERDGLRNIVVKSAALRGRGDITVWLPPDAGALDSLPIAILLHGVYGSHWGWTMDGGAHLTAARLISEGRIQPLALAMPSDGLWGDGSGYVTHPDFDFERWIAEDVPWAVRLTLPERLRERSPLAIAGLSMGGFGALRIGAKYGRERFFAVSGHSSVTELSQMSLFTEEPLEMFGAPPSDRSVVETICRSRDSLAPLRFDCGLGDHLLFENRALHDLLEAEGISHTYEEFDGSHEWAYWEAHLEDTLLFIDANRPAAG